MTAFVDSPALLAPELHERYQRDGYLLLPSLVDDQWLAELRAAELVPGTT